MPFIVDSLHFSKLYKIVVKWPALIAIMPLYKGLYSKTLAKYTFIKDRKSLNILFSARNGLLLWKREKTDTGQTLYDIEAYMKKIEEQLSIFEDKVTIVYTVFTLTPMLILLSIIAGFNLSYTILVTLLLYIATFTRILREYMLLVKHPRMLLLKAGSAMLILLLSLLVTYRINVVVILFSVIMSFISKRKTKCIVEVVSNMNRLYALLSKSRVRLSPYHVFLVSAQKMENSNTFKKPLISTLYTMRTGLVFINSRNIVINSIVHVAHQSPSSLERYLRYIGPLVGQYKVLLSSALSKARGLQFRTDILCLASSIALGVFSALSHLDPYLSSVIASLSFISKYYLDELMDYLSPRRTKTAYILIPAYGLSRHVALLLLSYITRTLPTSL